MSDGNLSKEDYEERACPFCTPGERETIPLMRITEKLDDYLFRKDFDGAVRHLEYWVREAEAVGDMRGKLSLYNELIGLYRKLEVRDKAINYADQAIMLAKETGYDDSVTMGTTYLNAATAYKAFGMNQQAVGLYEKALSLYEKYLKSGDERFAGLYNNMALALMDVGQYQRSREYFLRALDLNEDIAGSEAESAVTYCNLADLAEKMLGYTAAKSKIDGYMEKAMEKMRAVEDEDGYFAYMCEKCAPVFRYYGFAEYAGELEDKSGKIYRQAGVTE